MNDAPPRSGRISIRLSSYPEFLGYLSRRLSRTSSLRGSFAITTDRQEGLEVRLLPTQTPGVWRLGVKDFSQAEYLAAYFRGPDFKSWAGSIIGVQRAPTGRTDIEPTTYAETTSSFRGHTYHTDVWEIGNQGIMMCRWPEQGSGGIATPFVLDKQETLFEMTYFDSARDAPQGYKEAELVFVDSSF